MISLTSFTYLKAEKWMPCDAFRVWKDVIDNVPVKERIKGIEVWRQAWKGINQGEQYLEYKFDVVDEDSGELTEMYMNCSIEMNKLMVKCNYYPPIIQQAFKKYKA